MARDREKKSVSLDALRRLLAQADIDIDDGEGGGEPAAPALAVAAAPAPPPAAPPRPASADAATEDRFRALEETNRRLEQQLAEERQERQKTTKAQLRATVLAQAENWADGLIRLGAAIPAERGELVSLHAQAAMDDHDYPAKVAYLDSANVPKTGTRVEALHAVWAKRGRHDFSTEHIAPRDVPAEGGAGAPLVDLAALPTRPGADPLGKEMAEAAREWGGRMNGK